MSEIESAGSLDKPSDLGDKPSSVVKRWTLELNLAEKTEKTWRGKVVKILDRYRNEKERANSFNILWPITETLQQSIYNTMPKPDVRRRFRDEDPIGKYVGQVIERCATYAIDVYDFDDVLKTTVMDMLMCGRGVSWVRYVPTFEELSDADNEHGEDPEGPPASYQSLSGEMTECENVQWDDFRRGPGKTWKEVRWVARRHRFSRDMLTEKFPKVGATIPLDDVEDEQIKKSEVADIFKSLEVWEIWDKDTRQVLFIAPSYKNAPLDTRPDPLELRDFFPCPRPLYAIKDSSTLIPTPLFEMYRTQADELETISGRIVNLTKRLKVKGVYNSVLSEMKSLESAQEGDLIPSANAIALADSGGLEKNIWMFPIQMIAQVLQVLMEQREACKQVIYELTGIADIMRGATDARETKGAQVLKSQWGTQRLQRMQKELQRYARDVIRLKSEIICNKFQPESLIEMSGIKLLKDKNEKAMLQQQAKAFEDYQKQQQAQQQAQQPQQGQPQGMPQ